jgi:CRP-like cAMP-binding protein
MQTGERVAIKVLKLPDRRDGDARRSGRARPREERESERFYSGGVDKSDLAFEDIANEIEILKALDHPAVLHLHAHYVSDHGDKVYLVTDLLEGGELLDALLDRGNYTEADAGAIMRPVLEGLAYLHGRGVTHRDLKLENLLLADAADLSSVRIADFGLAKAAFSAAGGDRPGVGAICGTPSYLAPEIIAGQRYTPAVDCWAAGVCLYILLSGVVPFNWTDRPGADLRELFDRISAGAYSLDGPEWEGVSQDAKALVRGLMCVDVPRRLTAQAALAHRWLAAPAAGAPPTPLAHLPASQAKLRAFATATRLPVRRFRAGEYLVRQGERVAEVFLIRTGECEVLRDMPAGAAPMRLALAGEGEFVGRPVALDGQGNAVDVDLPEDEDEGVDADDGGDGGGGDRRSAGATPDQGAASSSSTAGSGRVRALGDKYATRFMGPRRGTRCARAAFARAHARAGERASRPADCVRNANVPRAACVHVSRRTRLQRRHLRRSLG